MKQNATRKLVTPELTEPERISPQVVTERRITFPERLWECVNDPSDLIRWSHKGDSVIVDEERFEKEVSVSTAFSTNF